MHHFELELGVLTIQNTATLLLHRLTSPLSAQPTTIAQRREHGKDHRLDYLGEEVTIFQANSRDDNVLDKTTTCGRTNTRPQSFVSELSVRLADSIVYQLSSPIYVSQS